MNINTFSFHRPLRSHEGAVSQEPEAWQAIVADVPEAIEYPRLQVYVVVPPNVVSVLVKDPWGIVGGDPQSTDEFTFIL